MYDALSKTLRQSQGDKDSDSVKTAVRLRCVYPELAEAIYEDLKKFDFIQV